MQVVVNGEAQEIEAGTTLGAYLKMRGVEQARTVVERNLEIVPAGAFDRTVLKEGDRLEILAFVGGG